MKKCYICDSICGSGKTSAAINMINQSEEDDKFLYITPYLSEVERVIMNCPEKKFKQPDEALGTKFKTVQYLISKGRNIVSTHALFKYFDQDICESLRAQGYTLIMDEVFEVVEPYSISDSDLATLLEKYVRINDRNLLEWTDEDYTGEKFALEKKLCAQEALGIFNNQALLWLFPATVFESFRNVYILTYLFDSQVQRYYYDMYNIEYEYIYVKGDNIKNYQFTLDKSERSAVPDYKDYIHIVDNEKLNAIGDGDTALSKSWYIANARNGCLEQLQRNVLNFFKHISKTSVSENMWTTFKDYKNRIKGKGYTKGYVACNARATNEFRNKTALAYTINRYFNPNIKNFFLAQGIQVKEGEYAASELIQWLFRSALRDKKPIIVYIPSARMRWLLEAWVKFDQG